MIYPRQLLIGLLALQLLVLAGVLLIGCGGGANPPAEPVVRSLAVAFEPQRPGPGMAVAFPVAAADWKAEDDGWSLEDPFLGVVLQL